MRRRWQFNRDALTVFALGWFVAALALMLATMDMGDPMVRGDSNPQLWALLLWLGPFALAILGAAVYGLWRWLTSENGWFIKRAWEPVREDLREGK